MRKVISCGEAETGHVVVEVLGDLPVARVVRVALRHREGPVGHQLAGAVDVQRAVGGGDAVVVFEAPVAADLRALLEAVEGDAAGGEDLTGGQARAAGADDADLLRFGHAANLPTRALSWHSPGLDDRRTGCKAPLADLGGSDTARPLGADPRARPRREHRPGPGDGLHPARRDRLLPRRRPGGGAAQLGCHDPGAAHLRLLRRRHPPPCRRRGRDAAARKPAAGDSLDQHRPRGGPPDQPARPGQPDQARRPGDPGAEAELRPEARADRDQAPAPAFQPHLLPRHGKGRGHLLAAAAAPHPRLRRRLLAAGGDRLPRRRRGADRRRPPAGSQRPATSRAGAKPSSACPRPAPAFPGSSPATSTRPSTSGTCARSSTAATATPARSPEGG